MAKSVPVGGIHISITGNSVDFRKAVKSARSEIWKLKNAFAPLTSAARTAGLALAATSGAALLMGRNLADGIDRLGKLSTSLRTSVADLQAFEMTAGLQGVDFTKATNGLKKLQVVAGQIASGRAYSEVTEEWDKLGLKIEDIIDLPIVAQFERITAAIREMVPAGEQAATASAFFGTRNAADLMRMTGEIEASRRALERYGVTLSQTATRNTEAMNDAMLVLSLIFKNFARNMVARYAPSIKRWVKEVQAGLAPGGRFRELLEKLAEGFRLAATATVEFIDIMSRVITKERVMAVAVAAMVVAGTRLTLMLYGAGAAMVRFTAAMVTGQSIASGLAVTLGMLKGGIGGVVMTIATLGLTVAGGVAAYNTLRAEMSSVNTLATEQAGIIGDLAAKYDMLMTSLDPASNGPEAVMAEMRAKIEELRAEAVKAENRIAGGDAFKEVGGRISRLTERRDNMRPGSGRDAADRKIAELNAEQRAMLEPVTELLNLADEWEAKLENVRVATEVNSKEMSDFGKVAQTAFEKMEGSFDSWFDKYRDGLADAGDLFDTFAREALKHLVKLWAFQPLMGALGGAGGTNPFGGSTGLLGSIFGFKSGGNHPGGWAVVGEGGPELINSGPGRIYNNADSRRMLNGATGFDLNIKVGGDRADIRNAVEAKIMELAPRIAEMAVSQATMDAGRPSPLNSRIRGAR